LKQTIASIVSQTTPTFSVVVYTLYKTNFLLIFTLDIKYNTYFTYLIT
jgi:hypothetical protein